MNFRASLWSYVEEGVVGRLWQIAKKVIICISSFIILLLEWGIVPVNTPMLYLLHRLIKINIGFIIQVHI